jgi:hypothetical protein
MQLQTAMMDFLHFEDNAPRWVVFQTGLKHQLEDCDLRKAVCEQTELLLTVQLDQGWLHGVPMFQG